MIYTLTKWMLKLPDVLLLWMSGQPQLTASGGRKMDPANQLVLLTSLKQQTLFVDESKSVPELREWWTEQLKPFAKPPLKGVSHRDLHVEVEGARVRVREYTPEGISDRAAGLVYLHGGGFTAFDIETYQGFCEYIAKELSVKVYSVGYRLAPEHPFPIPLEDCCAAYCWVREQADELGLDPDRISLGGDSAGGNMTAALCLKLRDEGLPAPRSQLLIYPSADLRCAFDEGPSRFASIDEFAEGQIIGRTHLRFFHRNYVPDPEQMSHPYASPLLADSHAGLPPAVIITAGFDPLRDEAQALAEAYEAAGVSTQYEEFSGLGHGFILADASQMVQEANRSICNRIRPLL